MLRPEERGTLTKIKDLTSAAVSRGQQLVQLYTHPEEIADAVVDAFIFGKDDHIRQGLYLAHLAANGRCNVLFLTEYDLMRHSVVRGTLFEQFARHHTGDDPLSEIHVHRDDLEVVFLLVLCNALGHARALNTKYDFKDTSLPELARLLDQGKIFDHVI